MDHARKNIHCRRGADECPNPVFKHDPVRTIRSPGPVMSENCTRCGKSFFGKRARPRGILAVDENILTSIHQNDCEPYGECDKRKAEHDIDQALPRPHRYAKRCGRARLFIITNRRRHGNLPPRTATETRS